jgi:subtilase family serine protease
VVGLAVVGLALMPVAAAHAALTRVGSRPSAVPAVVSRHAVLTSTRLHVTVTLRPRDPAALAAYARAVATRGSPDYRRYLTPAQFARHFGATPAQVSAVRSSLRVRGLHPGAVSAGRLSIPIVAGAGALERAFRVSLAQLVLPGRRTAIAASARPAIASGVADLVQSVLGLDTTSSPRPLLVRQARASVRSGAARPHVVTGGAQPCPSAQSAASSAGAYTADQIASAYGFSGLYGSGDLGQGVTVAVYELEPNTSSDIAAYQSCYGTHATISYVPVDSGAGTGPGSGEAALDIENLIGLAPAVNVLVYQGPNSNSGAPGSGPYDTFSTIINQDRASVVTVSWGQCESALGQTNAVAESTLFEQATVQGQSIVAASGDNGSEDCDNPGSVPQTQLAVDDPSSQPFVTGVGGTSLTALGPRPTETVWNSGAALLSPALQSGAAGGGVSNFWPMPAAQLDAAAALDVRTAQAAGTACNNSGGYCRQVPDVSADADPSHGYLVYWNGDSSVYGEPAGWQGIGGTSGAAPLWAALIALADGSRACAGSPVGYANPALYRAAGTAYANDFNDVTAGNNDLTGTNGGRYGAAAGYDPASGLGTPNAAALAAGLCANTVRLSGPGTQRSTIHTPVSLRLRGSDTTGAAVSYGAVGLPPGLTLNSTTGQVSGKPSKAGTYAVRAAARDSESAGATASFTWIVGAAPRISRLSLVSTSAGPLLAFTVAAGTDAPLLRTLTIAVPHNLRVIAKRGVAVTSTARKPLAQRFGDRASGTTLTITLRKDTRSVRVRIGPPSLSVRGGRVAASALRGGSRLSLSVSVLDAGSGTSKLTAKVKVAAR